MSTQNNLPEYYALTQALDQQQVAVTATEMHGLISGLVCGGNSGKEWLPLIYQLTNDGIAFPVNLLQQIQSLFSITYQALEGGGFNFNLLLPEEDQASVFERADAVAGWVNHFLLGLGMMQPKLGKTKGITQEAIDDLRNIAQLGYDEEDSAEELAYSLEEIIEYVRVAAMLCHDEFSARKLSLSARIDKPTLH